MSTHVALRKRKAQTRGLVLMAGLVALAGCRKSSFPDVEPGYREYAYVANAGSNTVSVLDLVAVRSDRTLQVGEHPIALAGNPRRDEIYVLNAGHAERPSSLSVLDPQSNSIVATIVLHHGAAALAIEPSGHRAYVVNQSSATVSVVDLDTRRMIATAPSGLGPGGIAVTPDGRTLVVTNAGSGSVSVYTILPIGPPVTLRSTLSGCPGASDPTILPDSSKAFVACSAGHQVLALSLALPADDWNTRQDASLKSDHALALLDVGQQPTHLTMKPDGGEIFVSNSISDTVSEIATQTNEVGSTYPIGNGPAHGVVSGAKTGGDALWIANSGADSLSLYSITDGRLVSILRTGNAPDAVALSADEHLLLAADSKSGDVTVIRTQGKLGPGLFTMLPAGEGPSAILVKAMQAKP